MSDGRKEQAMTPRAGLGRKTALLALTFMFAGTAALATTMILDPPRAQADQTQTQTTTTTPGSTGQPETNSGECGPFKPACDAANQFRGPGTALVGGLSGLGLLVGGGLLGIGQQAGMRIMAISAAAGGGIMVGNGVVSVLT
jgi:hypothetical protein